MQSLLFSLLAEEGVKDFSVSMALVDYIPVVFFALAALILSKDFYGKMGRTAYALFSAGTVSVTVAGALKATYKLLYALGVCDFQALSDLFMPLQAIGFLLTGVAMITFLFKPGKKMTSLAVAPPFFGGTFVFVGCMILGLLGMVVGLCTLAAQKKKYGAVALFIVSFVCSMCMGYLSSQDFDLAIFNWIAEGVNVVGQGTMLWGSMMLHSAFKKKI